MKEKPKPESWADHATLKTVRPEVRHILESSPAFHRLAPDEKRELAAKMVKVATYMVNPEGLAAKEFSPAGGLLAESQPKGALAESQPKGAPARAQADAVEDTKARLAKSPGSTGADFKAGAVDAGVKAYGDLVAKVDFPKFVSGLIQNVFQAIVDSSIQQMRAYGELLGNVAKTVDQFAQDNITENNARDWLTQKYPDKLGLDTSGADTEFADDTPAAPPPSPKITVTAEDQEGALKAISDDLGLAKPIGDISDEAEERRLVMGARLQIARGRQQMLASMVVLGINRIVVTDGLIHAKVVFDMKASDKATRKARASMYDRAEQASTSSFGASFSSWLSPVSASYNETDSSDHVTTVQSSVDDTSQSKAEVKANLTGEVRVNFKSDYFPMEKMANPQMIAAIQGNAKPPDKPVSGT
jgi:hypothetical protein